MSKYQHVLYATDLAEEAFDSAKQAQTIANAFQASLTIIHVIEPLPIYAYSYIDTFSLEKKQMDDADIALSKLGEELKIDAKNLILKVGPAKNEIVKSADELKTDLIIVGSHKHNPLATLLGSTADGVSHAAHCDVLILRFK